MTWDNFIAHWETALVIAIIGFIIVMLWREVFRPAFTLFIGVAVLVLSGILTPGQALSGFSNQQLAEIVLLLIVGNILRKSSIIDSGFKFLLSPQDGAQGFVFKMSAGIGSLSAFFNNTPLVVLMMPYVFSWSRIKKLPVSKFLIPLSYASILGGCVTLIGTSTNMIANGLAVENHGLEPLGMFDFTPVGLPLMVVGIAYLVFFSYRMLPDNKDSIEEFITASREFFLETHIEVGSPLIGQTIEEGGLRNLEGLFLVEILREGENIRPVSSLEVLRQGDVLFFAGSIDAIADITQPGLGLSLSKEAGHGQLDTANIAEVVVSHNSRLAGQKVRDSDFRGQYDGAILAIHRNGEKVFGQLGKVELKAGDVLLIMAGKEFAKRVANDPAVYVLSQQTRPQDVNVKSISLLLVGMFAAVVLATFGVPLFTSLMVLISAAILLKEVNPKEIVNSLDYNLILVMAFGFALGEAMIHTGTAQLIADTFLSFGSGWGAIGILATLFVLTNVLSAIATTLAAVNLIIPISIQIGQTMGLPLEPFVMIVAFGGAANFLTPIGYQTNLMVYGPGGYRFKDFFRVGLPLTILYLIGSVGILAWWFGMN